MIVNAPLIAPFPRISRVHLWLAYEVLRLFLASPLASALRIAVLSGAYFGVLDVVVDGPSLRAPVSFTILHRMGGSANSSGLESSFDAVSGPARPVPTSRLVVALRIAAIPMAVVLVMIPTSWRLPLVLTFVVPAMIVARRAFRS